MAKLLLVDDDTFCRNIVSRRLERHGFDMVTAADGREAVQAARVHRPDLIVMALDVPVADERRTLNALLSDPRTFRTPIIVLTNSASPEDVAAAVEAGCHSCDTKPVALARLIERIEGALGLTSSSPESSPSEAEKTGRPSGSC